MKPRGPRDTGRSLCYNGYIVKDNIVKLREGKKGRLKPGHPWIFKGQILKLTYDTRPGDIVTVINSEDEFIGRGYYNPASNITVRLLTFKDEPVDDTFLRGRIKDAVRKREHLSNITNAKRLVYSEADGLPGLIADLYDETLVFQVFTLGMERLKESILKAIIETVNPKYIYEKSDSPFRKIEGLKPAKGWIAMTMTESHRGGGIAVEIQENAAKFIVDIEKGHKTGFYLDQRKARLALRSISKGKNVLDLFCYTGGFSINAALGGASQVTAVDIKPGWLAAGRENAALNGVSDKINFVEGDVFFTLKKIFDSGGKFDIIVLDPPSFAKDRHSIVTASKGYKELNMLAMKSLNAGGILCTFSCSHNMSNDIFSNIVKESALAAGKTFTVLKRCRQDKDHPIIKEIPETEYLKGYFLKF